MERLTRKDHQALLEFLEGLYALRSLDALVSYILKALPQVIRSAPITAYVEMDPARSTSANWVDPAVSPAIEKSWAHFMHEHPVLAHYMKTGDGHAHKISDFLTQTQFHRLGLFNEHYRPMRVEDVMAISAPASTTLVLGIALTRERCDFSERDRLLLNLLRPHLVGAHENALALARIQTELTVIQQGLEALSAAVVAVTRGNGRIRLMSRRAREIFQAYFPQSHSSGDSLPEPVQVWLEHQEDLLGSMDRVPSMRQPLLVEGAKHLIIRLVSDNTGHILLLEERPSGSELPLPNLESLGLTPREGEVLRWASRAKTNREVAAILRTSPRTVGKHLEHIYEKLGVNNRTAAVTEALSSSRPSHTPDSRRNVRERTRGALRSDARH